MPNDFSSDSTILALYNLETGALTTDSKGSNTLTDVNTVTADGTNYKQGSYSGSFASASTQLLYRAYADLPSDWPFKSTNSIGSTTLWFRPATLPGSSAYMGLVGQYDATGNNRVWEIYLYNTNGVLRFNNGYNSGGNGESYDVYTGIVATQWYWLGVSIDVTNKRWYWLLWSDTDGKYIGGGWIKTANTMSINESTKFAIGAHQATTGYTNYFNGCIDEVTIWNSFLSTSDMLAIRTGTYSSTGAHLTMTSARNFYVDPYVWADNNRLYYSGESWTCANSGMTVPSAGMIQGDTMLVKKATKHDVGTATWSNNDSLITLDTANVTKMINDGEANWTAGGANSCDTNTTSFNENTKSATTTVVTAFTTGLASYKATGTLNLSAYDRISFWFLTGTALAAGKIRIDLCTVNDGTGAVNSFTINKYLAANQGYFFTLEPDTPASLSSAIESIAITVLSDLSTTANVVLYIDDVIACNSTLHLMGAIGLDDGYWYAIRSINATAIRTGYVAASSPASMKHHGTGNNATTYFYEAGGMHNTTGPISTLSTSCSGGVSDTSRMDIKGGINSADDSQDGYTVLMSTYLGYNSLIDTNGVDYLNYSNFIGVRTAGALYNYTGVSIYCKFTNISLACPGVNGVIYGQTTYLSPIELTGDWYITNMRSDFMEPRTAGYYVSRIYGSANFLIRGEIVSNVYPFNLHQCSGTYLTGKVTINIPNPTSAVYGCSLFYCHDCYIREMEIKGGYPNGITSYLSSGCRIGKLTISGLTTALESSTSGLNIIENLVITSGSYATIFNTGGGYDYNSASAWAVERYNADDRWRIDKLDGTISDHITGGQAAGWAYSGSGLSMYFNPNSTVYPLVYSFRVPVSTGTEYEIHMQVRMTASFDGSMKISIMGAGITPIDSASITLTESWAEYQSDSFTTTYSGYVTVYLSVLNGATTGDVGVDYIQLVEV